MDESRDLPPAGFDLDSRADGVAIARLAVADEFEAKPMVRGFGVVPQQFHRSAVVGERKVGPTVVVPIGDRETAAHVGLAKVRSRLLAHFAEAALSFTHEKLRGLTLLMSQERPRVLINVAVRLGEVEVAIEVGVEKVDAEAERLGGRGADARRVAPFLEGEFPLVQEDLGGFVLIVGDEERRPARAIDVARGDAHAGHEATVAIEPRAAEHAAFLERAVASVVEEVGRAEIVGDVDVEFAIAVEIDEQDGEAAARRGTCDAGRDAGIRKRAVAVVVKELVRGLRKDRRRADVKRILLGVLARWIAVEIDHAIVADVEVEPAVAIEIAPGTTGSPVGIRDFGSGGHVFEAPPARCVRIGDVVKQ